jgi:uncharacterized protein (TIRG00374 family)
MLLKTISSYNFKKIIKLIFSLLILVFIIIYLINQQDKLILISKTNHNILFKIIVCGLLSSLAIAIGFRNSMILFNVPLKIKEWIGLSLTNTMYSYIIPFQGSMLLRAKYLKSKYKFEYSKYAALSGGSLIIGFWVAGISALILLLTSYIKTGLYNKPLILMVGSLLVLTLIMSLILWYIPENRLKTGWKELDNIIAQIISGVKVFKTNTKQLIVISITYLFSFLLLGLRLYFSFQSVDISVGLTDILIIQMLAVFSMVLAITPGNLVVREGIIGLLSNTIGIPIEISFLAATIDRAIGMAIIFLFGTIYHFILMRELNDDLTEK